MSLCCSSCESPVNRGVLSRRRRRVGSAERDSAFEPRRRFYYHVNLMEAYCCAQSSSTEMSFSTHRPSLIFYNVVSNGRCSGVKGSPGTFFGLAVYGEFLFWSDWEQHAVMRSDKLTGADVTVLRADSPQQPRASPPWLTTHTAVSHTHLTKQDTLYVCVCVCGSK
ncbi:hypothetical protein SRHO_G00310550 [Serrasalmus rhombeus]